MKQALTSTKRRVNKSFLQTKGLGLRRQSSSQPRCAILHFHTLQTNKCFYATGDAGESTPPAASLLLACRWSIRPNGHRPAFVTLQATEYSLRRLQQLGAKARASLHFHSLRALMFNIIFNFAQPRPVPARLRIVNLLLYLDDKAGDQPMFCLRSATTTATNARRRPANSCAEQAANKENLVTLLDRELRGVPHNGLLYVHLTGAVPASGRLKRVQATKQGGEHAAQTTPQYSVLKPFANSPSGA